MSAAGKQARIFDDYAHSDDPVIAERAKNWQIGIGLQAVDNLSVSSFLLEVAERQILGEISMHDAVRLIEEHHGIKNREGANDEQDRRAD